MTYKLDGSESSNEVTGRGGAQTVKSKAKWDGEPRRQTTRDFNGMTITTKEGAPARRQDMIVGGHGADAAGRAEAQDGLYERRLDALG